MKKTLSIIIVAAILSGCEKYLPDSLVAENDLITVTLSLSGDVSVQEEPLTKSTRSSDLIGIQVYQDGAPYAYGLFNGGRNISINLHSGKDYAFKAQLIKDGTSKMTYLTIDSGEPCYNTAGSWYSAVDYWDDYEVIPKIRHIGSTVYYFESGNYLSSGYGEPFCLDGISYYTGYSTLTALYYSSTGRLRGYQFGGRLPNVAFPVLKETNSFVYDDTQTICITSSFIRSSEPLEQDRYYGEKALSSAQRSMNVVSIDMKHLVYGIQCNVTGVSDGTASITIKNGDHTLLEKSDITGEYHSESKIYTFEDLQSAWQYSDNYTENITISMTWIRGVGITQDLGSRVVQVKRNCVNVINVSLGAIIPNSSSAAFSVEE